MNYGALHLDRLAWISTAKGSRATYGAAKFLFQTPRYPAELGHFYRIPGAITLSSTERDIEHSGFLKFIKDLEASASAALGYCSEPMFALKKLTAFDVTEVFNGNGEYIVDPEDQFEPGVYDVSCLLQVMGTWASGSSWGLRLKVLQLKIHGPGTLRPLPHQEWAFVDEEDTIDHKYSEATV